ncbi:peptidyl-prolyl cis-trans isomerase FKBP2 [Thrips palmi]|uniref:peptidylprolyl isomerase n=1 Tax=Thrips palmi TaxID=161013 RepID=A0A6P9A6J6_THRPL|nr:peptidyl-prolyl cis-trans isomerase FKBP2 [Thrips palmi]
MKTNLTLWLCCTLLAVVLSSVNGDSASKKRLQIGVRKKIANCSYRAKNGDGLSVHYAGRLEDGTEFDSSYERGQPLSLTLGAGQVIKGWEQGLLGMCVGEKRKLVIPSHLGYGSNGAPPKIPGDATLIFEVELVGIDGRHGDDL